MILEEWLYMHDPKFVAPDLILGNIFERKQTFIDHSRKHITVPELGQHGMLNRLTFSD